MTCQTSSQRTKGLNVFLVIGITTIIACIMAYAQGSTWHKGKDAGKAGVFAFGFEDVPVGKLPSGWKVDATRLRGPMETWQVVEDRTAPSGSHVLAMIHPNHKFGGTFNICWTKSISFMDGELTVRFKANRGKEDQGGGIMWRVQNKNNYYVARFNPLEDNLCVYSVVNGVRRTYACATIKLPAGKWHAMKIVQHGKRYEVYLNGRKRLEGKADAINCAGGVGVWTKSDAVTAFDDFSVRVAKQEIKKQEK